MTHATQPFAVDGPYPDRADRLPRRLEQVTPAWLTGQLARRYPGVEVHNFEIVECKNSHTTKLRVALDLNDVGQAAIPNQLCLKSNWSGLRTGLICEREARFYHLIGDALVSDALTDAVPRSYFSDWDVDVRGDGSGNGIVVMEDLGVSPGAFGTSSDHLGVDGVAAGLESLALIHGGLWGDPRLDSWDWLAPSMATENDTEQVIQFWHYIWFNLTDPEYEAVVPVWVYDNPGLMNHVLDELSAFERELPGPRCLVHGDAHQGNSFLRASGERIWVDWQLVRKGSPWRDVNYFIVGGLTVEERRSADRELVAHYRQRLIATGALGVPDGDEAWRQFMRWPAYGTQAWLGNINQWGQRNGVEMVKRQFAASDDYDTVGILTRGKTPRRALIPGEGALGLAPELQKQVDARLASR
jgi:hypothetical protein